MVSRPLLLRLLARLEASPLPRTDPVWTELEWEILTLLEARAIGTKALAVARPVRRDSGVVPIGAVGRRG